MSVETIRDQDQLNYEIRSQKEGCFLRMFLPNKDIENWIKNGNFAYIKRELQIYNGIKFTCKKDKNGCDYLFFFKNKESKNHISNMLYELIVANKKTPLIFCETEEAKYTGDSSTQTDEINVCAWF